MGYQKVILSLVTTMIFSFSGLAQVSDDATVNENLMVRIAALEIYPEYLEEYKNILKEESEASVRLEPGVICIYPMYQKEHPNQIRLLEIYVDTNAYQSHLRTPHFLKYKTATLKMVKHLELIDMEAMDPESMPSIFTKLE